MAEERPKVLKGRRVLVVEDEMILAMDIEALLEDEGCVVLELAPSIARAISVLEAEKPDVASLDMNLNGESTAPVAAELRKRGVPFVVVTGYSKTDGVDELFGNAPIIRKPINTVAFIEEIVRLLE